MIATDRYTAPYWPPEQRADIERRVPAGHRLTVTHGGRRFRANLFRLDGELVAWDTALRPQVAAERVLRMAGVTVTTDAAGWIKEIA